MAPSDMDSEEKPKKKPFYLSLKRPRKKKGNLHMNEMGLEESGGGEGAECSSELKHHNVISAVTSGEKLVEQV